MPGKQWDDEDESSSGSEASSSPAVPAGALRRATKFEDEEDNDSDVLDSWDADDSEVEREKAAVAAKAKAEAEAAKAAAAAAKKSKGLRIAEKQAQRQAELAALAEPRENETETERRERMRRHEQEADLQHAADLFGDAGLSAGTGSGVRKSAAVLKASAVAVDKADPSKTVDLAALPLLNPITKAQFDALCSTLAPLIAANAKKPHYSLFVQDLVKELCRGLPSDQIKKAASTLTVLSNDKLREEKAAEKGGKKSKAAKTKTSLAVGRPNTVDTGAYDDDGGYGDDDFM
ncbi:eukaryotic translation initiation factor 3 subunit [Grosmannia clavigera kw1407]|uniref:Eukaryotic translation initiation factor 3 subunit J n=1 Tax=Grosmannia clavigera (strain kw1407 / UAMH 11150) TaxID=655863 RepID=F0XPF4_GROCL|nr:eukaryotic translation initiation factor 3 subunit [Grosmannia clavigera kw1407]EFX00538.1 eukaryotic translation initiation factor 3 subunit [Grosmannia clavigera kw1407]